MFSVSVPFNTLGATSGAGTAYPSGAPEFTPDFFGVHVTRSLVLYVCFVDHYFSFFFWPFVLSVLRFTESDYPFGIFKLMILCFIVFSPHLAIKIYSEHCIGGVMSSVLVWSMVDGGFEHQLGQTKHYEN
jgi:hypothetical protein